jgi:hypothetical protein
LQKDDMLISKRQFHCGQWEIYLFLNYYCHFLVNILQNKYTWPTLGQTSQWIFNNADLHQANSLKLSCLLQSSYKLVQQPTTQWSQSGWDFGLEPQTWFRYVLWWATTCNSTRLATLRHHYLHSSTFEMHYFMPPSVGVDLNQRFISLNLGNYG